MVAKRGPGPVGVPVGSGIRPGLPVGLALVRDAEIIGAEPFFHEFVSGIERVLVPRGVPVLLQVVPSIPEAVVRLRRWAQEGRVQGVILIDLEPDDVRVDLVRELALPTVVVGDPVTAAGLPTVWTQDDDAMRVVVDALADLGHVHVGHVAGPARMAHTIIRRRTFEAAAATRGLTVSLYDGDYSETAGVRAAAEVAESADGPTALVFDNDVMAIAALGEARRRGVDVPGELSLVAWDDSALCQLASPSLTAISHDVQGVGELVGEALSEVLSGRAAAVRNPPPSTLVLRESTDHR
ncbi:LacI family DNA-binding transcriptional regulator [Cellulomonas hominis]